jgi:hypothetical protein
MAISEPYRTFFAELENRSNEFAAEFDHDMRRRFDSGDSTVLLQYIYVCFNERVAVPPWVQEKFRAAIDKFHRREIKSWDEVFGRPLLKGKQLATEQRKLRLAGPIYQRVYERHMAGEPVTKALFDEVGKEVGVSGTVAAEIYYELKNGFLTDDDRL